MPASPHPGFFTTLKVSGSVVPGQTIQLTWSISGPADGNVIATISFNNVIVYTSKSIPMVGQFVAAPQSTPTQPGRVTYSPLFEGGEKNVLVVTTPSSQPAQAGLYLLGQHTLTLSVVSDNEPAPFTAIAKFRVVPENIDASWWKWLAQPSLEWNIPYTVGGDFYNKSKWSVMKTQLTLNEIDLLSNQTTNRGTQSITADVGPNANLIEFPSITQNWAWVTSPSGTYAGPIDKSYNYDVIVQLQDPWGNGYAPLSIGPFTTTVSVPDNKLNDQNAAAAAFASSIALLASGAVAGIFTFGIAAAACAVAAAVAVAVATAFCTQAADPPTPDPDYLTLVKVRPFKLPGSSTSGTALPSTLSFLKSVLESIAINVAMNLTEGKLIAARRDGNMKAVTLQTTAYRELVRGILRTADMLRSSLLETIKEIEVNPDLAVENTRDAVRYFQTYGTTDEFQKLMTVVEVSSSSVKAMEQFILTVDPTTLRSITESMTLLAQASLLNIEFLHQNMNKVLGPIAHLGKSKAKHPKPRRGTRSK